MPRTSPLTPTRLLVAGVLLVMGLTGCKATADPGTLPEATPSSPGSGTTSESMSYVAMGDSYTAAPLFPLDEDLIIDSCLRSSANYPTLVAQGLKTDVVDVSCSGASTVSIFNRQQFTSSTQPPQIDAIDASTDLITIGIGANDFRFFSRMIFTCLRVADRDVEGAPCRDLNRGVAGHDKLQRKLVKIRSNVGRVVEALAERAPDARILLVGYPQLLPDEGTCRPRLPLAIGDYAYALELNLMLADAVKQGGLAAGAEYVDLVGASQGHDICADKPWVAGVRGKAEYAAGLHPYPAEQAAVARLVLKAI